MPYSFLSFTLKKLGLSDFTEFSEHWAYRFLNISDGPKQPGFEVRVSKLMAQGSTTWFFLGSLPLKMSCCSQEPCLLGEATPPWIAGDACSVVGGW